jgi:murein DD-endopeptidase MepM/ murein hydrolase activator NlpD
MAKLLIGVVLIAAIIIGVVVIFPKKGEYDAPRPVNDSAFNDTSEQPPVKIKGIGVNLDYYNPETKMAGDVRFKGQDFDFKPSFEEFGIWREPVGGFEGSFNPQPMWSVPKGTKVHALVDGFVKDVPKLYSGDYSVVVVTSMDSRWTYETEHVNNPIVKPGDFVKAGQVVAEASTANSNGDWAWFEIGIGRGTQNSWEKPKHVCPFAYLDDSIKEKTLKKITALMTEWEKFANKPNGYNQSKMPIPGCLTLDTVEG